MQIEVLNGEDGKTVVRGVNPAQDGAEFAGSILEPGQSVSITLPDVHEPEGVQFGEVASIAQEAPAEQPEQPAEAPAEGGTPEQPAEAPAEGGQDVPGEPPVGDEGAAPEGEQPAGE